MDTGEKGHYEQQHAQHNEQQTEEWRNPLLHFTEAISTEF